MSSQPTASAQPGLTVSAARRLAQAAGFSEASLLALPHGDELREAARLEAWLGAGAHGSMQYLERRNEAGERLRARVAAAVPWARSAVICLAGYHSAQPRSLDPAPEGAAWIARYAWSGRQEAKGEEKPSDYHKVLKRRLRGLEARLKAEFGEFESRVFVDSGPLLERSLAAAAGLGWIGKNTCLIHPRLGSWTFLAVLLTSLPAREGEPPATLTPDRCGSCRRCLEACPTGALTAPRQMDARRCIAYLTIEHRGPLDERLLESMGRQVFGCDICQDVCPWNRRAPIAADAELTPRRTLVNPSLEQLATLEEQDFERIFAGSPVRRAGFDGFRRNLAVAMGNSGQQRHRARLLAWLEPAGGPLRAAIAWALTRLQA
jgi:epoxyqueuosine reductase